MKISIIIPVYNVAPYLRECLGSIAKAIEQCKSESVKCKVEDVEVICVDDGSTDGSAEILDEYAERYDSGQWVVGSGLRFKVIHQTNQGVSAARNRGLEVAAGDWVWFVDGDDMIHPDSLKMIVKGIAENPTVDIAKIDLVSGEVPSEAWKPDVGECSRLLCESDPERAIMGLQGASQYVMRRAVIGDLRFEPFRWLEDILFVVRYLTRCHDLLVLPSPVYFYRTRQGSAMHSTYTGEQVSEIFRALNVLVDAADSLVRRHPESDYRNYLKRLHVYAYFGFGERYFKLPATARGALLGDWLRLQDRFAGRYAISWEWRMRLALVRLFRSGRLVRPLVLWGSSWRGVVSKVLSGMKGVCKCA